MTPGLVERHPLKEKRRANKPLLERKRRARINDSLADLKTLVLSSLNKDVSKYTKMEKVDILDMTVQFLKGKCFEKPIEDHMSVYRAGYTECTQQIYRSIMSMDGLDHSNKYKILSKIAERLHPDERLMTPPPSPKSYCPKTTYPTGHTVPCIPPPSHFERSPTRPAFIDPTKSGHLPPKGGHLPPKGVPLPADVDCMKNLNRDLRTPPYPMNNERLSPLNNEFRVSYSSRYEVLREEHLVASSKLTRHSPYAKFMDPHLEKVAARLENGSSSVWRPW